MRDLVSNLPSGQQRPAKNLEEDTVVAILNTIHEIVTDSSENARSLIQAQAIEKLVAINRTRWATSLRMLLVWLHIGGPLFLGCRGIFSRNTTNGHWVKFEACSTHVCGVH